MPAPSPSPLLESSAEDGLGQGEVRGDKQEETLGSFVVRDSFGVLGQGGSEQVGIVGDAPHFDNSTITMAV